MLSIQSNNNGDQVGAGVQQVELIGQIGRISSSLSQATSEKEILSVLGQYAGKNGATSIKLTYFQTGNQGQLAEDVATWTAAGIQQVEMWWMNTYRPENAVLGSVWLKAGDSALFIDDAESDSRLSGLDDTARSSVLHDYGRSLVIIPMKRDGVWQGVITIGWLNKHEFSAEERTIYESLLQTLSAIAFNRQAYLQAETVQRRYEVIAKTNAALGQAIDEDEILQAVAALVKEYGAALSSLNYTHYDDTDEVARLEVVSFYMGGKRIPPESIPNGTFRTRADTPLWNLMLGDQPFFIEDMRTDPRADEMTRANAAQARVIAFIALPLNLNNKRQGTISFGWPESHIFPAELQEILTVITPTITAVVANRRLLTQAVSMYRLTEERLRAVVNNAPLMLYSLDKEGKFNLAEGKGLENYNLKPGELLGQSAFDFYRDYPDVLDAIKHGLAGENFAALLNVNEATYQAWYSPSLDKRGEVTGLISVAFDISERKRAELALEKANRQLRDASRFKDEFLAVMSHELRTPLNAMIGLLGIALMEGNLVEDDQMLVTRARANSERLLTLINNILDISRMEAGRLELINVPVALRPMVSKLRSDVSILAEQKKLELTVDVAASVPEEVMLDQDSITKILTNLVANAIKFTDQGSVSLKIAATSDQLLIEMKDTGVGIPAHMQQVIFESFRQADASSTRRHGGSGLGLAIVHSLCIAMGGSIRVDSKPGAGSTFSVNLPLVRVAAAVN